MAPVVGSATSSVPRSSVSLATTLRPSPHSFQRITRRSEVLFCMPTRPPLYQYNPSAPASVSLAAGLTSFDSLVRKSIRSTPRKSATYSTLPSSVIVMPLG